MAEVARYQPPERTVTDGVRRPPWRGERKGGGRCAPFASSSLTKNEVEWGLGVMSLANELNPAKDWVDQLKANLYD